MTNPWGESFAIDSRLLNVGLGAFLTCPIWDVPNIALECRWNDNFGCSKQLYVHYYTVQCNFIMDYSVILQFHFGLHGCIEILSFICSFVKIQNMPLHWNSSACVRFGPFWPINLTNREPNPCCRTNAIRMSKIKPAFDLLSRSQNTILHASFIKHYVYYALNYIVCLIYLCNKLWRKYDN